MPWSNAFKPALSTVILAGLGVFAFVLARTWPNLFPDVETTLEVDPTCDLRLGPCVRELPVGGHMVFSIHPPDLPLMETLQLRVETRDFSITGVQVDIVGLNMNMGQNRTTLSDFGGGDWRGETILPVCTTQVMQWQAAVWLHHDGRVVAIPHHFSTRRRGFGNEAEQPQQPQSD